MTNPLYTQLAISLATAIVTAFLTVWLALNRFYREKWWEVRMKAYTDLIKSLHQMKRFTNSMMHRAYEHRIDDETDHHRELRAANTVAWAEIHQYIDLGEFVIAPAALRLLRRFDHETSWDEDEDPVDYYEKCDIAIDRCLPALRRIAGQDLKLSR